MPPFELLDKQHIRNGKPKIETEHGRNEPDNFDADIFGKQYTVIDNIQRLPQLFIALTK